MLFFEPRISDDGTGSCVRCHQPALFGGDGLAKSMGLHDKTLSRNAPTVLNVGLYTRQHWDGRFASVEEQATHALLGPGFANPDYATAMARIKAIPGYATLFHQAFPGDAEPVSEVNWGKAIGAYERTLVSPSRFDNFLGDKADALSAPERKGLRTFIETGCVDCHHGPGLGGLEFRKFRVESDYWKTTGSKEIDKGRMGVTNDPAGLYKFKVAGLRNVAMTPPYFHDGSIDTLPKAVQIMAKVQLDADLSDTEVDQIVAFLESLTGRLPEGYAQAPALPPGGFVPQSSAPSRSQTK
jgi:cytochrome c peroxidase